MDGISSASAVISLTVQLISTTRDIINFLREIQDAPEELLSTIEFLDQLRGNLEEVKCLVEEQSLCVDLPSSVASIRAALKICESKIVLVEQCVNKFKGVLDRRSQVRKKWASLKHVLKKEEIKRLQKQLKWATKSLHTALMINVNRIGVRNIQAAAATSLSDGQLPVAQKSSMISSHGNQEHILGSSPASPILAKELKSTLLSNANVTHVNSATKLDSAHRVQKIHHAATSLSGNSEINEKPSSLPRFGNPVGKDRASGMFSFDSPRQPRVVSKERMICWYTGILGNISLRTKSRFTNDALSVHIVDKRSVSKESIIVIRPSFMKNHYELRFVNRGGYISPGLRTECVIDFKSPVFDMCRSGDIRGLRDAFDSGSVSLDAVNPLGMGLLHYAAGSFQRDLCSWLLDIGVGADRTSIMGSKALTYMGTQSRIGQTSAVTKTMIEIARLLAQAQEDLSAFDVSMWFQEYDGPPEGAELILSQDLTQCYICPPDDGDPLYPALASTLRLYAIDPKPWEPVIRTLIRHGADVHAPVRRNLSDLDQSEYTCPLAQYGTPLDELFIYTSNPLEGQAAARGWLQILASEGQDISVYLETESALHVRPMQLTHPSYRTMGYVNERKLIFDFEERPSVSWDWWISPSSSALLLREEFKLMALTPPDWMLITDSWKKAWPIRYPVWSERHQSNGEDLSCSRYESFLDMAKARSAKRLAKKARKTSRAEKHEGSRKVPGAWL